MATKTGSDVLVMLFGGYDLRPQMNAIPTFNRDGVVEDTTPFGVDDQQQTYTGMRKFAFGIQGFWDSAGSAVALEALLGTTAPACVGIDGNAAGARFTGWQSCENTYQRQAKVGAVTRITAGFVHTGNTEIDEGVILEPLSTVTANGNSSTYDQGAASSNGLVAYLQVPAFTLGTATNLTLTAEDSADNSSFAALTGGVFTAVTAAPNAQRIVVSGTIRRYVRLYWTWTGGAGGGSSATIFCGINIGTVASGQVFLVAPDRIVQPPQHDGEPGAVLTSAGIAPIESVPDVRQEFPPAPIEGEQA